MPATIAATKTMACMLPVPSATRAGPGQKPANPQPTPKVSEPSTSRLSISSFFGRRMGSPNNEVGRPPAILKATKPTAMAPPITSASDGSQPPKRSKKESTFAGLDKPLRIKPKPNNRPTSSALTDCLRISESSKDVANDINSEKACRHKRQRSD